VSSSSLRRRLFSGLSSGATTAGELEGAAAGVSRAGGPIVDEDGEAADMALLREAFIDDSVAASFAGGRDDCGVGTGVCC
jgi:hypothetical protein